MSYYENTNCSLLLIIKLLLLLTLYTADLAASSPCTRKCGGIKIPFPFGVEKGCFLDKYYQIECRNTSRKLVPFLLSTGQEVVSITLPSQENPLHDFATMYGLVRVKRQITSTGCAADGNEPAGGSIMNLTGTPFFCDSLNSLAAVGCNSKVFLRHVKPNIVLCDLNCNTSRDSRIINDTPFFNLTRCSANLSSCAEEKQEAVCDGNGCCQVGLPNDPQQLIDISIEGNDGNLTSCRVAFLTDEVYNMSSGTEPQELFSKGYATVTLGWVIQTTNQSFLGSLPCKFIKDNTTYSTAPETKCSCLEIFISGMSYANCECDKGYSGNVYEPEGCEEIDECKTMHEVCGKGSTCVNTRGGYQCVGDKTKAIALGVGAGFGVLVLIVGLWASRKLILKRRVTRRKMKFFKRNGGLLLQQELNTRQGNVEPTRIFSSKELEKATDNFSENRVLGHGGQGTVYKGMLVDGRMVAVKKSKIIDEDKLQEFINEVVILSQINHRHIVKLLGCCLETEVPILVYEFILNGNLFQHIHEKSEDYTMIWGMRLRIAVDMAGALSYLHSSANSPIYHRDIKSSNILLDEKYRAKVADFGTSRSITIDQTHWTTVVSGTVGYLDPEYYRSSQYTEKSDVYSFGVVLAELITGDKPVIMIQHTQEIISLAEHFRLAMKENRLSDTMDARIRDDCKPEQVMAVAKLAMKCLSSKGKKRPNMREVYTELERICTSPEEDSQVQVQNDDEEDEEEEEEDMKIIIRNNSRSIGVTAPALASSSLDVEPLFPRPTW